MARVLGAPHSATRIVVNNSTMPVFFRTSLILSVIALCLVILTVCKLSTSASVGVEELFVKSEMFDQMESSMSQEPMKDISTDVPRSMKLMEDGFPQSKQMNSDSSMIVMHRNDNAKDRAGKRAQSIVRKFKGMIGKNDGSSPAWSEDRLSMSGNKLPRLQTDFGPSNHPPSKPIF
jgi:hypothetical protein